MNRAERRAAGRPLPPMCPPLKHRYSRISGTYQGKEVAVRVVCARCRRTADEILAASPADREAFERFREGQG